MTTNLKTLTATVKQSVHTVDDLAGGVEALALTISFRVATWLSAIPTLALTSRTIATLFEMQPGAALSSSIALELVGQSVVNQWSAAQEWNTRKAKTDSQGRSRLLFGAMCVYFLADFVFIGILELPKAFSGQWQHLASMIFPLMQVISTFVTVERAAQFRREASAEQQKAERRAERERRKAERNESRDTDATLAPYRDTIAALAASTATTKSDFDAWLASLNGERATLTRNDVLTWAQSRGMDVSVATGKSNRDKVNRWCRNENIQEG